MFVCCLRVLRARFEAPGLPAQPALNPPTATSRTDLVWKSSSLCNHTTHVLIQVAKILNLHAYGDIFTPFSRKVFGIKSPFGRSMTDETITPG